MKIGLFGGSFNPIHNGHLHIADQIYQVLALDRILFIPTGDPPHKRSTSLAPAHHRLQMVQLALPPFSHYAIDEQEIRAPGVSYSIDTVLALKKAYPQDTQFGFIVGLDAFLEFPTWKQADRLLQLCDFIVCSRPGVTFTQLQSLPLLPSLDNDTVRGLDARTTTHLDTPLPGGTRLRLLALPPSEISASKIRQACAQGHIPPDWLPPKVESYIIQHQLYQ